MPPIDNLDDKFITPSRSDLVTQYERDYTLYRPGAKIGPKSQVNVDAKLIVDQVLPLYAKADSLSRLAALEDMSSSQLENEAARMGLEPRLAATGASGFVKANASKLGGDILDGDECVDVNDASLRFRCLVSATYHDGDPVPIEAITLGPATNLPVGRVLQWSNPRAGIGSECTVLIQGDGTGLSGGHEEETDPELIERIRDARARPAASGNDAEYQRVVRDTPGLPIQQVFTYPAINGPGTTAIVFTLRPASAGGSRIPNLSQINQAEQHLRGKMPADDSAFFGDLVPIAQDMHILVDWATLARGWSDATPWPTYALLSSGRWLVSASSTPTATVFRVSEGSNTRPAPSAGNTIGFFDAAKRVYRRKRILSVSVVSAGLYELTCDVANGASDTSYTPAVGETFCPWSDSLQSLVPKAIQLFDSMGPGEQITPILDDELRQRRSPRSPDQWPNTITGRSIQVFYALPTVTEIDAVSPVPPYKTPVGVPQDHSNLLTLGSLYAFPRS